MTDQLTGKIYLAVQDIRTLAARTRQDCRGKRDCIDCPARISTLDQLDFECLFSLCDTMRERAWRNDRKKSSAGYVSSSWRRLPQSSVSETGGDATRRVAW